MEQVIPRTCINHSNKEVREMAETAWTLIVGGFVVTVAIGVAYLTIYLGRG